MSSCGHSTTFCFLPPTLTFLKENFPSLTRDTSIDRSLLRCRLCDLIDTQYAADIAENGPPNNEREADIEKQIADLKQAITEGVQTDDENALPQLQRKLSVAVRATDERILEVWMRYWAVWGPGDGPQRGHEEFEDPDELKELKDDDFEIEFPPEETVVEKGVSATTASKSPMGRKPVTKKPVSEKSAAKKAINEKCVSKKQSTRKSTSKKTGIEKKTAPRKAVTEQAVTTDSSPQLERKRKAPGRAESPPAESFTKPFVRRGRPAKRGKK